MNIGTIVTPNQKGQIVIPQKVRLDLDIKPQKPLNLITRGRIIYIYPINEVITSSEQESSYPEILKKTQGAWTNENWDNLRKKKRKTELNASKQRKKTW